LDLIALQWLLSNEYNFVFHPGQEYRDQNFNVYSFFKKLMIYYFLLYVRKSRLTLKVKFTSSITWNIIIIMKGKGKAVCGSYSTAALWHIVLLPERVPSFISRGAAHTKRRERPLLAKEGTISGI
jgi:hypothetical protein